MRLLITIRFGKDYTLSRLSHYMTAPGIAFDCMLKHTNVKLERLKQYEFQIFRESGVRGGICHLVKKHVKTNIPSIKNIVYDSNKPVMWLAYLDCVNLYGKSMLSTLPYRNFEWFDDLSIDTTQIKDDAEYGYILEVDVIYPKHMKIIPIFRFDPRINVHQILK
ncbi:hypothetical protein QTP88_027254 [Uroleucon formosanum]